MSPTLIWSVQFYNERRGLLARYSVEAALPPEAVILARRALVGAYPPGTAPARPASLYQKARAEPGDGGWVLYRIGNVSELDQPLGGRGVQAPDA